MKTTFYHGTSADNLESILKYGLSCSESKIWTCSQDAVYLWEPQQVGEAEGYEDCPEYWDEIAFRHANESGQVACAIAKDCRVVVLKIELERDEVETDYSCENMEHASCIYRDILPSEIVEIQISNDLKLIQGYFICCISDRDYNNLEFTDMELKIAACFKNCELYESLEELIQFEKLELIKA